MTLSPDLEPDTPAPTDVDAIEARARAAVAELRHAREAGRGADGRFQTNNAAALKDGLRSRLVDRSPQVAAALREREDQILGHLGGAAEAGVLRGVLARELARTLLLADSHWAELEDRGIVSKGKARAAERHYLAASQRAERLAVQLGLDPKSIKVGVAGIVADVKRGGGDVR